MKPTLPGDFLNAFKELFGTAGLDVFDGTKNARCRAQAEVGLVQETQIAFEFHRARHRLQIARTQLEELLAEHVL